MTRPQWVWRTRLVDRLPRQAGYVVWLEAPYGYGKTTLLRQWSETLESEGWSVVWASAASGPILEQVARALKLPGSPPWPFVQEVLGSRPTLLILDDLAADTPVPLRLPSGSLTLGLASRGQLGWPELPRARAEGRLIHLTPEDLRFTLLETQQVLAEGRTAFEVWERTGGWPIAVHLAALTGTLDFRRALAEGVRDSLRDEEWQAMLALAAVPALPESLQDGAVQRLLEAGFVRKTPHGVSLHAVFGEVLLDELLPSVQQAIRRMSPHLPPELRAEAYFRAKLWQDTEQLLECPDALELASKAPSWVIRWCRALPGLGGPWRRLAHGMALCLLGRLSQALPRLRSLAEQSEGSHPEVAIQAWGLTAYYAPEVNLDLALEAADRGGQLVDRVSPRLAARFLNWTCWPLWKAGDLERFAAALEKARRLLPADDPYVFHPIGYNLAFLRWQRDGDLDYYLAYNRQTAELQEAERSHNLPLTLLQIGRLLVLTGQREEAVQCFQRARANPGQNFWAETIAAAWQACLEQDLAPFQRLVTLAETAENPELEDIVRGLWARTLRELGHLADSLRVSHPARGFWTALESALALWAGGRTTEALAQLPSAPRDREERAYFYAARFRILREERDLDELVNLTSLGPQILPALVPLPELPRSRPEVADSYPVREVLAAAWKEAVQRRLREVPPLEVELLGQYRVLRLGEEVSLSPTARALLVLLILGLSRDTIADQLWPDARPAQAQNNLHVHMHHLRRAVQPWGLPTYLTARGLRNVQVDLWTLQDALRRSDAPSVLRLYREPVAPGVDLPAVDEVRYQLRRQVVECLYRAGRQGTPEEGIRVLERVLELDPLHEAALQCLVRHLLAAGRPRDALEAYRVFAARLREELDAEPAPDTSALLQPLTRPTRSRRSR
ncbi:MAG: BTAD domain-containing putative transcriptional regulator [Armatimonadota bacterium]|nr:transcriptional regulator [Armatimonadota bacterium]MDW8155380.1 BTAD domain-containing putative transcriptional regulator [Armatimonadota bacterium]